jgi:peroxiredoxin
MRELVEKIKEDTKQEITYFTNGSGHSHGSKLGETIPQFSLADIHGNEITDDAFRGRETLVAFWSLTCPFCREMIADLRDWEMSKGPNDPELVLFSEGDIGEHQEFGLRSPVILEEGYKTAEKFGMYGTPSAVLVNENGKIISETAAGAPGIWALVGIKK